MIYLIKNELVSYLREPFAFIFSIVLPIALTFIYASSYGAYELSPTINGFDNSYLFNITFLIVNQGLMGLVISLSEKNTLNINKKYFLIDIVKYKYFFLSISSIFFTTIIILIVLTLLNWTIYDLSININFAFIFIIAISLFINYLIGHAVVKIFKSPKSSQAAGTILFFISLFFSGLIIPFDMFPQAIQNFAKYTPIALTYGSLANIYDNAINNYSLLHFSISAIIYCVIIFIILYVKEKHGKNI